MPHQFILKYLKPMRPIVQNMFENYAILIEDKIYLNARNNNNHPCDNGIWIGTKEKHHKSLITEYPALTESNMYNIKKWLFLPATAEDFKETAKQLCELIKSGDPRIGVQLQPLKSNLL